MAVLVHRKRPGVVDKVGIPISMRTPELLAVYSFWAVDGDVAVGAALPASAVCIDTTPLCEIGPDGMLRMLAGDGHPIVAGKAAGRDGKDAVMPASMSGSATTLSTGKAVLDWSSLKLKAPPADVAVRLVGKPLAWCFDADPTATGVTVSVREDKPQAVVGVSVTLAASGGQPAAGVRLLWRVTA